MAFIAIWLLFRYGFYSDMAFIAIWLLLRYGFYSDMAFIAIWLLLRYGFYSDMDFTPIWLLFQGSRQPRYNILMHALSYKDASPNNNDYLRSYGIVNRIFAIRKISVTIPGKHYSIQ